MALDYAIAVATAPFMFNYVRRALPFYAPVIYCFRYVALETIQTEPKRHRFFGWYCMYIACGSLGSLANTWPAYQVDGRCCIVYICIIIIQGVSELTPYWVHSKVLQMLSPCMLTGNGCSNHMLTF